MNKCKFLDILKDAEPFLRLFEVLIIGGLGIFISIKANQVAKSQLELEKLKVQPFFSVHEVFSPNDDGESNAIATIRVENIDGRAENIDIQTAMCIKVHYWVQDEYVEQSLSIYVPYFYGNQRWSGNSSGNIAELSYNDNNLILNRVSTEMLEDTSFDGYLEKEVIVKILYNDISGQQHCEYYSVNAFEQDHLGLDEGRVLFNQYSELPYRINTDDLSFANIKMLIQEQTAQ